MLNNDVFVWMLTKDQAYIESDDKLMVYSAVIQNKELIEYVACSLVNDDIL